MEILASRLTFYLEIIIMKIINNLGLQNTKATQIMRKIFCAAFCVSLLTAFAINTANADENEGGDSYAIGLWGDLAYSDAQAAVGVPNLIADMNAQRLAFTVHDGDLKAGGSVCSDALYLQWVDFFNTLKAPAMFTPGDNDWTDCDRVSAGGYHSLERLDFERKLFFNTPYSLGQRQTRQEVQTEALCLDKDGNKVACVENRRWTVGKVTYATLNVAGSCNNLCDIAPDAAEFAARNAANIKWLNETFAQATAKKSAAVMLITQANVGWDGSDPTRAPSRNPLTLAESAAATDGFKDFLVTLRNQTIAFKKPVAYVHGDSHYFRVDKPLLDTTGRRLENFTRIETFGDNQQNGNNDVQWLKVFVDAKSREVFAYQPQIVPANRVAVPAP
jgi:hypothetical protein